MPELPHAAEYRKYLEPKTLARISALDLRARLIVEGLMTGMHRSPYQGISVEFAQHRPYVAGDDIRHVDWKVLGTTDRVYLKQYQEETNLHLIFVVDGEPAGGFGRPLRLRQRTEAVSQTVQFPDAVEDPDAGTADGAAAEEDE